jgi:cell division protein FtsB
MSGSESPEWCEWASETMKKLNQENAALKAEVELLTRQSARDRMTADGAFKASCDDQSALFKVIQERDQLRAEVGKLHEGLKDHHDDWKRIQDAEREVERQRLIGWNLKSKEEFRLLRHYFSLNIMDSKLIYWILLVTKTFQKILIVC